MKKKLLVTGASGFLGWHLCRLAARDSSVAGCVFSHPLVVPAVEVLGVDLTSRRAVEQLFVAVKPDAVIHTAALSKADLCQQSPRRSYAINVEASAHIAACCASRSVPCVFTSTDLVFDGRHAPYREGDVPNAVSVYGQHKAMAEQKMRECWPQVTVCRLPLMYGGPAPLATGFLGPLIESVRQGRKLHLFVDEFRTPVNVEAAAAGLLMALEKAPTSTLHLGGHQRVSRYRLGQLVVQALGASDELLVRASQADVPLAAPRPADVTLDSSAARQLGYQPPPLDEDLPVVVRCYVTAGGGA